MKADELPHGAHSEPSCPIIADIATVPNQDYPEQPKWTQSYRVSYKGE